MGLSAYITDLNMKNELRCALIPSGGQLGASNGRKIGIKELKSMRYEQVRSVLGWDD